MNKFISDHKQSLLLVGALATFYAITFYQRMNKAKNDDLEKKQLERLQMNQEVKQVKARPRPELRRASTLIFNEIKAAFQSNMNMLPHLSQWIDPQGRNFQSPLLFKDCLINHTSQSSRFVVEQSFVREGTFVLGQKQYNSLEQIHKAPRFVRGGARKELFFDPKNCRAAIVTCGGLCPGLNVVIRQIVMCLWYNYGCKQIWGIKYGYKGFYTEPSDNFWIELNPSVVSKIHYSGGTILGSSRGGFDGTKIIQSLKKRNINLLFCIGGDGTHRGIGELYKIVNDQKLQISIGGIPKTIDNDIPIIDKSFGFDTAVHQSVNAIDCVNTQAIACEKGVGIVKLMGRNAGFIAMYASLASRDVNFCFIPEFEVNLYGKNGVFDRVCQRLTSKNHCIIVLAEGIDDSVRDLSDKSGRDVDASGNKLHKDIGVLFKSEIVKYGKQNYGFDITAKYIDPTYLIRAVPPIASDKILCTKLAQNVVHGVLAGYTGFTVGQVRGALVFIPVELINSNKSRKVRLEDADFQRLLASTGQGQPLCFVS